MNTNNLSTTDRWRALAKETGADPLELAAREIERYQASNRALRADREVLRDRLVNHLAPRSA